MQRAAEPGRETLTPRTGVTAPNRPEDTAGGVVAPKTRRDVLKWGLFGSTAFDVRRPRSNVPVILHAEKGGNFRRQNYRAWFNS